MRLKKNNKGFTLLEILIVLVILGVIAGLAIPAYQASVEKSRSQEALSNIAAVKDSLVRYFALSNTYVGACFNGGLTSTPACPANWPNPLDYDPAANTGGQTTHFTYGLGALAVNTFTITATRVKAANEAAAPPAGGIQMKQDGSIVKTGIYGA